MVSTQVIGRQADRQGKGDFPQGRLLGSASETLETDLGQQQPQGCLNPVQTESQWEHRNTTQAEEREYTAHLQTRVTFQVSYLLLTVEVYEHSLL